jgi:Ca-activated chloride channel family protein
VDDVSALGLGGSTLAFEHPAWLMLALAAPLFFLMLRASLADFSRRQLALQAALRALVLAGVAVVLAGPSLRRPARAVSVVAVADVSDSLSDAALAAERTALARLAAAARDRGAPPPRLVRFAGQPDEISSADALARFAAPGGAATDLALAVGFGAGLVDTTAIPRLLLLSDGLATRGDLTATAARLADRDIALYALAPPPAETGDVAIVALAAPDDIRPHVPFRIDVRLLADRPAKGRVRLDADGSGRIAIEEPERTLAIPAGATTVAFTARVTEPGTTTLRAKLTAEPVDRHPENDEGVLAVATAREPRVLCLEGASGVAAPFARALERERIATDVRPARAARDGELGRYDLVVLADVPRAALGDAAMAALDGFVRAGGGLLVAGGTQSFGPGGYTGSRLEAMLPLRLDIPDKREEATLALALVIDKSGSMAGAKMELTKEAARATAEAMPAADQIAVITFDSQAQAVVRLQRAANRQRIFGDIARIHASGGTNILAGLREAVDELLPARARKKHIILLSDGQSPYEEIPDLVDAAQTAKITMSAVGVGDGADQTLLKMVAARGGGRFYHTRDPASIPRIFSRETSELGDQSIVERPTAARVAKRIAALAGVPVETAPALGGYVVTRPRPQAETIMATGDGAPLLARWQLGLGTVSAWTSDLGGRWAAAWTRWPPFEKLWAQVARATMRPRAATHFAIRSRRIADAVALTIDALGADDRFLTGLEGAVDVTEVPPGGQAGPPRSLPLSETAPGRYEASFRPGIDAGALLFQAALRAGRNPVAEADGRMTLPFAPELRPRPPTGAGDEGAAALAAAAARTGGRVVTDPAELFAPGADRRETRQPLRTPVLLGVLGLFLVDVLFRRVRLRRHFADGDVDSPA